MKGNKLLSVIRFTILYDLTVESRGDVYQLKFKITNILLFEVRVYKPFFGKARNAENIQMIKKIIFPLPPIIQPSNVFSRYDGYNFLAKRTRNIHICTINCFIYFVLHFSLDLKNSLKKTN